MIRGASLVSTQNYVESPFIIVKIGKYTFGHCSKIDRDKLGASFNITYPNFMDSLNITKVNGAVNTYSINMIYAITQRDDPNMLEKVFSSVSNSREITLSYGDWNMPSFIYREETAVITKVQTKVNLQASTINYVITCTSTALSLTAGTFSFPGRKAKPSDVLIELLSNQRYGLTQIFTGMRNLTTVALNNFIARDDQKVQLEARTSISVLDYISYLVSCMTSEQDKDAKIKTSCYFWSVYDDTSNEFGGTYFKVVRVAANTNQYVSFNTYEVDVGYPSATMVVDFNVNNDDSWALLYDYSEKIQQPEYTYSIDNDGNLLSTRSSVLTSSSKYLTTTETQRNWWSLVTQFPITATLTIKGLLRPAMLMSYVKVNTYFYGHKHTSSGLYIITKQQDVINNQGYRTTLSLTRVGGDEFYA